MRKKKGGNERHPFLRHSNAVVQQSGGQL